MLKKEHQIMIAGVGLIIMLTIFVVSGIFEVKRLDDCKNKRIRTFNKDDFTWTGIVEEVRQGKYQPKCL